MRRATIRSFIRNPEYVRICNTGHVTNGHWAFKSGMMPKAFRDKIDKIVQNEPNKKYPPPDLQSILNDMKGKKYVEVFPVEEKDLESTDLETIVYQSKDKSFQVGFDMDYILYLKRNVKGMKILACSSDTPAKIIVQGISDFEKRRRMIIGILMPKRF